MVTNCMIDLKSYCKAGMLALNSSCLALVLLGALVAVAFAVVVSGGDGSDPPDVAWAASMFKLDVIANVYDEVPRRDR